MSEDALEDIIAPGLSVLFCGINPGLTSAISGHHFQNRSNRFWRVLQQSGFTPTRIEPENDRTILDFGFGLTTAVPRPTRQANELSASDCLGVETALLRKLAQYKPRYIAFLGKQAYGALGGKDLQWGRQKFELLGTKVWMLPNPSGLNRNFSLESLVLAFAALREEALDASHRSR